MCDILMTPREERVRGREREDECRCDGGWDCMKERGAVFFLLKGYASGLAAWFSTHEWF